MPEKGFPPEAVLMIAMGVAVCCLFLRLLFLRKMVGLSIRRYLVNVCGNVLMVTSFAFVFPIIIVLQVSDGLPRFFFICIASVVNSIMSIYWIGCTSSERNFIRDKVFRIIRNII